MTRPPIERCPEERSGNSNAERGRCLRIAGHPSAHRFFDDDAVKLWDEIARLRHNERCYREDLQDAQREAREAYAEVQILEAAHGGQS